MTLIICNINRDILECKYHGSYYITSDLSPILIETYWNVNLGPFSGTGGGGGILIETYWNVNVAFRDDGIDMTVY